MLSLRNLALHFRDGRDLLKPVSLDVAPAEVVTLMGPSGCGKSSLLACIGGNLPDAIVASGDMSLDGERLNEVSPQHRNIAQLFQDDLLFPHMTVGENLLFAIGRGARDARVQLMRDTLKRVDLDGYENRAPHTLSGGQRSRVALMRALLAKPKAILLDEPFSKLDAQLRQQMRDDTFAHIIRQNIPALLVTHDVGDAPPNGRVFKISKDGTVLHV